MLTDRELLEHQLAERVGPILTDGTPLRDLIDLERREVSFRVLHDPEIYRLELRSIHARSWQLLAHESEIPNAGDFVLRSIGEDPVIVTRDRDGAVHVLLNVCAHRGMEVCWADQGNQSQFKCPYHGWVFDSKGNLLGAPFEQEMYGDWDKSQYGLKTARAATRSGVVFGCFDADAPSCDDWLGDMGFYFDELFMHGDLEVNGPAQRQLVHSNWKQMSDQVSGDFYHQATLHRSLYEMGFIQADPNDAKGWGIDNVKVGVPQGHGCNVTDSPLRMLGGDKERAGLFEGYFMAGVLFPSSIMYTLPFPKLDMSGVHVTGAFAGVMPRGLDHYEYWNIPIVPKSTSESDRETLRRAASMNGALALSDDLTTYPAIQRGTAGSVGQEQTLKFNTLLGPNKPDDWPGPGTVYSGFSKDDSQWQFWLRWFDMMTAPTG